jgi:hypothetical protein
VSDVSKVVVDANELAKLRADLARTTEALEAIFNLTDGEIEVRFRTSSTKTEEQMGRNSTIYSLLSLPRNMARDALRDRQ